MSLPTRTDLNTLKYAFQGQPFVNVVGNVSVVTTTLAYAFQGQPFIAIAGVTHAAPPRWKTIAVSHRATLLPRRVKTRAQLFRPTKPQAAAVVVHKRAVTTVLQALDRRRRRYTQRQAQLRKPPRFTGVVVAAGPAKRIRVVDFCGWQVIHRRYVAGHTQLGRIPRLFVPPCTAWGGSAGGGGYMAGGRRRRIHRIYRQDLLG
jgi:hypothetical protein